MNKTNSTQAKASTDRTWEKFILYNKKKNPKQNKTENPLPKSYNGLKYEWKIS